MSEPSSLDSNGDNAQAECTYIVCSLLTTFWRVLILNLSRGERGYLDFPFMTFASQPSACKICVTDHARLTRTYACLSITSQQPGPAPSLPQRNDRNDLCARGDDAEGAVIPPSL